MKKAVLLLALAAVLGGCVPRAEPPAASAAKAADAAHNSRNALDWAGAYEGVLPCADCPGLKTRLVLRADGGFDIRTQYLERQVAPQTTSGRFSWNDAGSRITLDAAGWGQQFQVGEGRLLQLNRDGSAPAWDAPNRVLTLQTQK